MARLTERPQVLLHVNFELNESEVRALHALTEYGTDPFLKVFYEKMGKTILGPHEDGLRSLFDSIRRELPV